MTFSTAAKYFAQELSYWQAVAAFAGTEAI